MQEFNSIVCSGGAVRVISVIGIIKYLEEHLMAKNIMNYVGTSAGAILCLFLTLNYKSDEIVKFLLENLYDDEFNKFDIDDMFNIFTEYGLSKGQLIITMLEKIIYNKLNKKDLTFLELAKINGKNLVVCVSNLTKKKYDFFNVDTTPDLSVITAIRISCSLPLIFTPLSVNGDLCLDGGIFNNFPINYFKDNKLRDILGINIEGQTSQNTDTFIQYIKLIVNTMIEKANNLSINDKDKNILTIEFKEENLEHWISFSDMKINFPKEKMKEYIKLGYDTIKSRFNLKS
jgi:predicted acylesterase/phospholipase RssA